MKPGTFSLFAAAIFWILFWREPSFNWVLLVAAVAFTVSWAAMATRGRKP